MMKNTRHIFLLCFCAFVNAPHANILIEFLQAGGFSSVITPVTVKVDTSSENPGANVFWRAVLHVKQVSGKSVNKFLKGFDIVTQPSELNLEPGMLKLTLTILHQPAEEILVERLRGAQLKLDPQKIEYCGIAAVLKIIIGSGDSTEITVGNLQDFLENTMCFYNDVFKISIPSISDPSLNKAQNILNALDLYLAIYARREDNLGKDTKGLLRTWYQAHSGNVALQEYETRRSPKKDLTGACKYALVRIKIELPGSEIIIRTRAENIGDPAITEDNFVHYLTSFSTLPPMLGDMMANEDGITSRTQLDFTANINILTKNSYFTVSNSKQEGKRPDNVVNGLLSVLDMVERNLI